MAEGTPIFILKPSGPAPERVTYDSIMFYKTSPQNRIATYVGLASYDRLTYHGEYCQDGAASCEYSNKAWLDPNTGALNIRNLSQQNEDFYYIRNFASRSVPSPSVYHYEIYLTVFVQPEVPRLEGLDGIIEAQTEIILNCTIERIRPVASAIYWVMGGSIVNGTTVNSAPDPTDKSLEQINTVSYVFKTEQHGQTVECVFEPQYGTKVSAIRPVYIDFVDVVVRPPENGDDDNVWISGHMVWIIVGVVVFFLVIVTLLVAYIVRIKLRKRRHRQSVTDSMTATGEDPPLPVSEEDDYHTLNYDEMKPDILKIQQGDDSQGPEYIEIEGLAEQLGTYYNETSGASQVSERYIEIGADPNEQPNTLSNETSRASQASEYLEPVVSPSVSPYEQLSGHYANEPIDSGKPYDVLDP